MLASNLGQPSIDQCPLHDILKSYSTSTVISKKPHCVLSFLVEVTVVDVS